MAQEQENNRNRSITRNVSYNTVITAMTYLFGAVSMMYVSRKLQPAANGRVDFANSIVHYFVLIAGLGMPWYAIRCCARFREDRKKLTKVFSELFSLGLLLAVISGAVLAVLCLTVMEWHKGWNLQWFDRTVYIVVGLLSLVALFLWFCTDHYCTKVNLNILWLSPLFIYFAINPRRSNRNVVCVQLVMLLAAMVMTLGALPQQLNAAVMPIALMLAVRLISNLRGAKI